MTIDERSEDVSLILAGDTLYRNNEHKTQKTLDSRDDEIFPPTKHISYMAYDLYRHSQESSWEIRAKGEAMDTKGRMKIFLPIPTFLQDLLWRVAICRQNTPIPMFAKVPTESFMYIVRWLRGLPHPVLIDISHHYSKRSFCLHSTHHNFLSLHLNS